MDIEKFKKIEAIEYLKEELLIQQIELKVMKRMSMERIELIKEKIAVAEPKDKYLLSNLLKKKTEDKHFAENSLIAGENNIAFYQNRLNELLKKN